MEAIREHGLQGFDCAIVAEFASHEAALGYEAALISERKTIEVGFNTMAGGFRNGGRARDGAERDHLRAKAHDWQSQRGSYCDEISGKLRAFYATEDGLAQLARRKDTANRPEVRAAMSKSHGGRPVEVLDGDVVIATYATQGECARALGIRQGNLWACLHGRARSLRGLTFRFAATGGDVPADPGGGSSPSVA